MLGPVALYRFEKSQVTQVASVPDSGSKFKKRSDVGHVDSHHEVRRVALNSAKKVVSQSRYIIDCHFYMGMELQRVVYQDI